MSVIAVKVNKDNILIAGDSQTSWGAHKFNKKDTSDRHVIANSKIWKVNGMVIGCAGSVAHIGILQMFCKTCKPKEMNRDSIIQWIADFKQYAVDLTKEGFNDISVHGIVIADDKAFVFYDFMDAYEIKEGDFAAVGSGMWLAMGAMSVGADVIKAVETAIKYDMHCGGEITNYKIYKHTNEQPN